MTKVLFLDIDGVLNSEAWFLNTKPRKPIDKIDPDAVKLLNQVIERTGAVCVLSSSWRVFFGQEETQRILVENGFIGKIIDQTPDCAKLNESGIWDGAERGAEINEWLQTHPEVTTFAIVDDDDDMGQLTDKLVKTNWRTGLQQEHAAQLISLLL